MNRHLAILFTIFFISGFAGLTYEIVWAKYLALFLGATGYAQLLVLATFMGGLALGSWLLGSYADRMEHPLLGYVILEFGIGLWGVAFPFFFPFVRAGFVDAATAMNLNFGAIFFLKIIVCIAMILLPSVLMGGTLPIMTRVVVPYLAAVGRNVSSLYYINSCGAVFGCLGAGFVLIPRLGLHWTNWTAAGINIGVGVIAYLVFRRLAREHRDVGKIGRTVQAEADERNEVRESPRAQRIAVWVIGGSGALAMLYEVAWIRLLTLSMGSSTYSFSLMLAAFITGITIGSWWLSKKRTPGGYFFILGLCQAAIGFLVLLSMPIYAELPIIFHKWATMLNREPHAFPLYQVIKFALCFSVMVPPAIFFGMAVPAASHVASDNLKILGKKVGGVFAVNTFGTIVGTVVTGVVLLPKLGLHYTLVFGVILNFLLAIVVLFNCRPATAWVMRARLVTCSFFVFGLAAYLATSQWNVYLLNSGLYRRRDLLTSRPAATENAPRRNSFDPPAIYRLAMSEEELNYIHEPGKRYIDSIFHKDGVISSVAVFEHQTPPYQISLKVNGKTDASSHGDLGTQMMVGHLPLLIKGDAERALLVGLGSGITMGSMLRHPLKSLDVVEISPDVVEATGRFFGKYNYNVVDEHGRVTDPRAALYIEDAKTFLQVNPQKYDVIVNEPTNPWIAGVAGLFTDEFFKECAEHLTEDGLLVQWVQKYEFTDESISLIFDTLQRTFPYVLLWNSLEGDMVLVSSRRPFHPDLQNMERLFARPEIKNDLARIGIHSPLPLLMMQMGELPPPEENLASTPINSDYHMRLEYSAPLGFFIGKPAPITYRLDFRNDPTQARRLWLNRYRPERELSADEYFDFYANIYRFQIMPKKLIQSWVKLWIEDHPDDERAQVAWIYEQPGGLAEKRRLFEERLIPQSGELTTWITYCNVLVDLIEQHRVYLINQEFPLYERALKKCIALGVHNPWRYHYLLSEYCMINHRLDDALAQAWEGVESLPSVYDDDHGYRQQYYALIVELNLKNGDQKKAAEIFNKINPDSLPESKWRHLRARVTRKISSALTYNNLK